MKSQPIIFELKGTLDGREISPKTLDIRRAHEFLGEVKEFIFADKNIPASGVHIPFQYAEGSARFIAEVPENFVSTIENDLRGLTERGEKFEFAVPKRAAVLQKWRQNCQKNPGIEYGIGTANTQLSRINHETRLPNPVNQLYQSELYLFGRIMEWGGVSTSNIHIKTEEYGTVLVTIEPQLLALEETNRVYREAAIRVLATQNLLTGEILKAEFLEFADYAPGKNPDALVTAIKIGTPKWSDVPNAAEWVRDLRGEL